MFWKNSRHVSCSLRQRLKHMTFEVFRMIGIAKMKKRKRKMPSRTKWKATKATSRASATWYWQGWRCWLPRTRGRSHVLSVSYVRVLSPVWWTKETTRGWQKGARTLHWLHSCLRASELDMTENPLCTVLRSVQEQAHACGAASLVTARRDVLPHHSIISCRNMS